MKNNLEQQVKDSLSNYELPYDPKAWSAMRKKLDVARPVSKVPLYLGIVSGVAAVTTIVLLSIHFNKPEQQDKTPVETSQVSRTISKPNSKTNSNLLNSDTFNDQEFKENGNVIRNEMVVGPSRPDESIGSNVSERHGSNTSDRVNEPIEENVHEPILPIEDNSAFVHPSLDELICTGTSLNIRNQNNFPLIVETSSGQQVVVRSNESKRIDVQNAGKYFYGYIWNGDLVVKGDFTVQDSPTADFTVFRTDVKYDENGLPVTYVTSNELATEYKWHFEGMTADTREAAAHFFTKGTHDIELTLTASNGCMSSVKKQVMIEENYNLMAMTSFVPTDVDPANTTFMPYSLKLRNTPFRLIIIDPRDGHVIFESTDASLGWDGIDRQTGQMVPYETAYIWKVTLEKPLKNESPEYAGTVIPLSKRR